MFFISAWFYSGLGKRLLVFLLPLSLLASCHSDREPDTGAFAITKIEVDGNVSAGFFSGVSATPQIKFSFTKPLNPATVKNSVKLYGVGGEIAVTQTLSNNDSTLVIQPPTLNYLSKYQLDVANSLESASGKKLSTASSSQLITTYDPSDKFPAITDNELLDLVQKKTLGYFYDYAHPVSGMARERYNSGDYVTTGGTGFGLMAVVVGMERNFITRAQGITHLQKIISFLETADRFHGVWPHWINGSTGKVIPFSQKDDGGDLVETSFLMQGLITFRQYLKPGDPAEQALINRINALWEGVEWDWYRKGGENVLYWHWSPNYNWDMNFPMYGYFEEQITYFLAAASPTHPISKDVYTNGYGKNGAIKTGNTYYGYKLPLGTPSPLFWVHYSYLGLDPHFTDDFANYWEQNVNASLINHAYCAANPKKYVGYSDACWGLTSSDNAGGYAAHSPSNDLGVIAPTAALSSFPYTPIESMKALKFFYYKLGDKLVGNYGFYDSFNLSQAWFAGSYLAIDQGPIVVMIENYRSGLLWQLFASAPEVQAAKQKLGFIY